MMAYSMLGLQLCYEKWIYINGDSEPHSPLEVDADDLRPEYRAAKHLISMLPFKEVKNELTKWLDENFADKNTRDKIKKLVSAPEKLIKIADAYAKSEAKAEAKRNKTKSAREMIEQGDRAQKNAPRVSDPEIAPISEKAKKKREENLDKEFAASLDDFVYVARGLTFSRKPANREERAFLEQEYDGHCQICGKQINKYDGRRYFEAINIIKFSSMAEPLQNSSKYGWNSLCLCPNCAAEYNYCSKKISTIYEQVMAKDAEPDSDETIDIMIELPEGKKQAIQYSPRHFMALKEALKIFADKV